MKANKLILMAVDFGEQSKQAVDYAAYFAKKNNSEIMLLYVLEETSWISKFISSEKEEEIKEATSTDLVDLAKEFLAKHKGVKFSTRVEMGKPYEKILEVSNELKPEFIMMGKNEKSSLGQKILGSNTHHIINESNSPVLSIRGAINLDEVVTGEMNFTVPIDITKEVNAQLTAAIEYGKLFDARIDLYSVLTKDSIAEEVKALTRLHEAKEQIEKAGLKSTEKLEKQDTKSVAEMISAYAKAHKSELVIIITQQKQSTIDYFVGSNAKELLNNSSIPVLSVLPWQNNSESIFNYFVNPLGVL